jgi:glyoxylase-like metal-dependent hydrolase (beta-lactamase superfamily II)
MHRTRQSLALPLRSLFPGHGPPGGGARRRLAQLIEHRRWREGLVSGALHAGPATLTELLPRAYPDAPAAQRRWARRSLLAHLLALEKRGEAAREPAADAGPDADGAPADERGVWRLR